MVWLFYTLIAVNFAYGLTQSADCVTPSGQDGDCKNITLCEPVKDFLKLKISTKEDNEFLIKSVCGFEGTEVKVCCPRSERLCLTPERRTGKCVGLYFCKHLKEKLIPGITMEDLTYITDSRCNGPLAFSVCCGPPPDPEIPSPAALPPTTASCVLTSTPPDINSGCCGIDGSSSRITGGSAAGITQYPWLVQVELKKRNWIHPVCGGSLITGRHVLTAAHCFSKPDLGTPHSVRLGEYDMANPGPDCTQVEGGGEDCTDGAVRILMANYTIHAGYINKPVIYKNDIAIIRLAQLAPYTYFIRPICLPTTDIADKPPADLRLMVAGWGATDEAHIKSDVKMHVDLPYVDYQTCHTRYSFNVDESQLCAGGERDKDSCEGDSGGPLMHCNGSVTTAVGIVSYGTRVCGVLYPGVYTNVYQFLDWIRDNIKE